VHAHRSPLRLPLAVALLFAATIPAVAAPYWVAYAGEDFPENEGWDRGCGDETGWGHGAVRTIENDVLTLDGLRNEWICDYYLRDLPNDPPPGERFVAEWRLFVDQRSDAGDAGITIARHATPGHVSFRYGADGVSIRPGDITISLAAGEFHEFRFLSQDMLTYTLQVDDGLVVNGWFEDYTLLQSFVAFGDCVQGLRSYSQWDYCRYGIVPEPGALHCVLCVFAVLASRRCAAGSLHPAGHKGKRP
jgi:hypothetical protein